MTQAKTNPLKEWVAKGIIKGIIKAKAARWTVEGFRQCAANQYTLRDLMALDPKIVERMRHMARENPGLGKLTVQDFIVWIGESNPTLKAALDRDLSLQLWLTRVWRDGWKELTQD